MRPWLPLQAVKAEAQTLQFVPGGSLLLRSEEDGRRVGLRSPEGWDLAMLMARLGRPPLVIRGGQLRVDGLPVGTYQIGDAAAPLGTLSLSGQVRVGDSTKVDLD